MHKSQLILLLYISPSTRFRLVVPAELVCINDCWSYVSGLRSGRFNHAEQVQHEMPDQENLKDESDCVYKSVLDSEI